MKTLLAIFIAIWLAKFLAEVGIGFLQILAGLALCLLATVLHALARAIDMAVALWETAFPSNKHQ